ncbi:MAG TPA: SpoIID/LytB domain-containing protein [Thermoanaerobaculia bacterium]|nr:SpoIID/LytB domain-containing protein [Thermoanaerobaculia bacterium]
MRRLFFITLFLTACATTTPPTPDTTKPPPPVFRSANALTPVSSMPRAITEPKIRVGLLSDQATVVFPRTSDGYYLVTPQGPSTLKRGFTATAPLANATVRYAVQASVISDLTSAQEFAAKLKSDLNVRVDSVFDPASGAYKILVGDFESSEAATPMRSQLTERGYAKDPLVVRRPSDQPFEKKLEIVDDEGDRYTFTTDALDVAPMTGETVTIDKKPYRTVARLFVNARGLLNVVNVLNLEDYLFGVVPAEMGPTIYDELEALKAQAVAARTYAVRNLGQFGSEGFDICPGPACQAYNGFSGEADLSTRAVKETAGLILTYNGQPIDALYTATCGGETSDVGTMFPGRNEPYLKRAHCVELDLLTIAGRADSGLLSELQVNARLFAALAGVPEISSAWSAREVWQVVEKAMELTGARNPARSRPVSSRRGDVLAYLDEALGLASHARTLTLPEDRKYYFPQSANPEATPYAAAAFLVKYGINPAQFIDRVSLADPMPREELYALLGAWVREHNLLRDSEGKIFRLAGRGITLKQKGETSAFTLPAGIPIFRKLGDRFQEYTNVPILLGDRATIISAPDKRVVAMIVQANYDGAAFDRTSSFSNWTRSYRADELVPAINRRNPIQQLIDIRPLVIDASKRIAEMEVTAEGGRKFVLKGLPVRWSLNVPDNLFVYEKTKDPDGIDRYTFYGKGWGHGVGMCQVGAYGMAFRGWTYDRILKNFYTGVEITRR